MSIIVVGLPETLIGLLSAEGGPFHSLLKFNVYVTSSFRAVGGTVDS
jgi:hypothetical protein